MTAFDDGVGERPDGARPVGDESPKAGQYSDRKIDGMGHALRLMVAGAAELDACLPDIQDERIRVELGQVVENARFAAASLRAKLDSAASAGGGAESAVALALALEDLRSEVGRLGDRVDAAEEIAGFVPDGSMGNLLDQIRQPVEAFRHLLVLFLRTWADKGLVDIKFED